LERYRKQFEQFKNAGFSDSNQWALEALLRLLKFKEELVELGSIYPYLPQVLLPDNWIGFELKHVILEYLQFLYQRSSPLVDFAFPARLHRNGL
ncbi:MAG: hypothetical protein AB1798_12525, partial [Spirochaetota bacterium]